MSIPNGDLEQFTDWLQGFANLVKRQFKTDVHVTILIRNPRIKDANIIVTDDEWMDIHTTLDDLQAQEFGQS